MIIVFEGLDKSGKTTLLKAFQRSVNFEHVCIDRGPWSNIFYDMVIHGDHIDAEERARRMGSFQISALEMSKATDLVVICKSSYDVCVERHNEAGEVMAEHLYDYDKYKDLFVNVVATNNAMTKMSLVEIDTDRLSIVECVEKLIRCIGELREARESGLLRFAQT